MTHDLERELGEQPIARILANLELAPHDLVAASEVQMTHKMISRACKGRRLTRNVQEKVLAALNRASGKTLVLADLFNY